MSLKEDKKKKQARTKEKVSEKKDAKPIASFSVIFSIFRDPRIIRVNGARHLGVKGEIRSEILKMSYLSTQIDSEKVLRH